MVAPAVASLIAGPVGRRQPSRRPRRSPTTAPEPSIALNRPQSPSITLDTEPDCTIDRIVHASLTFNPNRTHYPDTWTTSPTPSPRSSPTSCWTHQPSTTDNIAEPEPGPDPSSMCNTELEHVQLIPPPTTSPILNPDLAADPEPNSPRARPRRRCCTRQQHRHSRRPRRRHHRQPHRGS
jgi:hypothetical protein